MLADADKHCFREVAMTCNFQIEKAVRLLNTNSSHTLAELATHCSLSISRLSHLFRAHTGLTVGEFRRKCRFEQAKRMLATTDMCIKQVAYALGYHHTSSFVRAFEQFVGMSPGEYRQYELAKSIAAVNANKQQEMLTAFD
jgi:AraC-like DNA-binding protein